MLNQECVNEANLEEIDINIKLPEMVYKESTRLHDLVCQTLPMSQNITSIFHITLYQACILKEDLAEIYQRIESICNSFKQFKIEMRVDLKKINKNLFWEAENSKTLQALHEKIALSVATLRKGVLRQYQNIDRQKMDKLAKQNFINFGSANVISRYNPHITIAYQLQTNDLAVKVIQPNESTLAFVAKSVGIGKIGYYGNVLQELRTFNL